MKKCEAIGFLKKMQKFARRFAFINKNDSGVNIWRGRQKTIAFIFEDEFAKLIARECKRHSHLVIFVDTRLSFYSTKMNSTTTINVKNSKGKYKRWHCPDILICRDDSGIECKQLKVLHIIELKTNAGYIRDWFKSKNGDVTRSMEKLKARFAKMRNELAKATIFAKSKIYCEAMDRKVQYRMEFSKNLKYDLVLLTSLNGIVKKDEDVSTIEINFNSEGSKIFFLSHAPITAQNKIKEEELNWDEEYGFSALIERITAFEE